MRASRRYTLPVDGPRASGSQVLVHQEHRNIRSQSNPEAQVPPAAGPVPGDVVTSPTITFPAYSHGFVRFGNGGGNGLKAC